MPPLDSAIISAEIRVDQQKKSTNNGKSHNDTSQELIRGKVTPYKMRINWLHAVLLTYTHIAATYGLYLMLSQAKLATTFFAWLLYCFQIFGITAGVHRLWSHKSYEATWQLRLILMIANTVARQLPIWGWAQIHRQHHKYTDTDADPVNAKRGFFFSHIGWLCVNKHPMVLEKKDSIDMSDLRADPIVMFQKKYFTPMTLVCCFFLPSVIPMYFWNESFNNAWHVSVMLRWCCGLNATYIVNSIAHIWGMKPYDKSLTSTNNVMISAASLGEGFHNYHHVFPWDYKTAELGKYGFNWTTALLDFFAKIGWAYNLKTVSDEMIRKRVLRTGDGTHPYSKTTDLQKRFIEHCDEHNEDEMVWGWDDPDVKAEDKTDVKIINKIN